MGRGSPGREEVGDEVGGEGSVGNDDEFSCVVKSQKRRSNKIYKTELTEIRYKIK